MSKFITVLIRRLGEGGSTPVPGSFQGLWSQVLSGGYPSPGWGSTSVLPRGTLVLAGGYPRTGVPLAKTGVPSVRIGVPLVRTWVHPCHDRGTSSLQPGLGPPPPGQDWGAPCQNRSTHQPVMGYTPAKTWVHGFFILKKTRKYGTGFLIPK